MTPLTARTTETEFEPSSGAQMFAPSKTAAAADEPMVTVCRTAPLGSSLSNLPGLETVTQTLVPSKSGLWGRPEPVVTVVTVQGIDRPGVTIETELEFVVQIRPPSKVMP